jgi:hypothetical protein
VSVADLGIAPARFFGLIENSPEKIRKILKKILVGVKCTKTPRRDAMRLAECLNLFQYGCRAASRKLITTSVSWELEVHRLPCRGKI